MSRQYIAKLETDVIFCKTAIKDDKMISDIEYSHNVRSMTEFKRRVHFRQATLIYRIEKYI